MRLPAKVAYNTLVQIGSKIIGTLLILAVAAIITRYLGQTGFGEYTTITTYLSFFAVIADLGLTLVTTQMISRAGVERDRVLGNLLALRLFSAIFFLALAPLTIIFLPYNPNIKFGVLITTLSFLFVALNQILVGLFQKELRLDKVAIAEVSGRLTLLAGVIIVVRINAGLTGVLIATIFASGISFLLHYLFSLSFSRLKFYFDLPIWREIISKSWPLTITIILNLIYLRADILLLSLLPRPSTIGILAEVGIYGAAYKIIDVLVTFPFVFSGIILPILTTYWTAGDKTAFRKVMQKSFEMMVILTVPLVIGTQFIARDIITLVAGPEFIAAGAILKILILAAGCIFLGNISAHAIIAIEQQKKTIPAYLFTAVTAVLGYLIFIPTYSYFGAAWVTLYSEFTIALAAFYFVWKYTSFLPQTKVVFKSLVASGLMAIAIMTLKSLNIYNLAIILTIASATYFLCLFLLKGLTKNDLLLLFNK